MKTSEGATMRHFIVQMGILIIGRNLPKLRSLALKEIWRGVLRTVNANALSGSPQTFRANATR